MLQSRSTRPVLAVAPGFINMLSWSTQSLLHDGKSQSEIRQGVTLQVMGEGWSMGPVNERVAENMENTKEPGFEWEIEWETLGGYLEHLVNRGVSTNVASYVGATTLRIYAIGFDDRPASDEELETMRGLVTAGDGGGSARSRVFADLCTGLLRRHRRAHRAGRGCCRIWRRVYLTPSKRRRSASRGHRGVDRDRSRDRRPGRDLTTSRRQANRTTGSWTKPSPLSKRHGPMVWLSPPTSTPTRLRQPGSMRRCLPGCKKEVSTRGSNGSATRRSDGESPRRCAPPTEEWENYFVGAGPENILLVGFKNPDLRLLTGRTLADVAAERGTSPEETAMDLVIEDRSRVDAVYFVMTEENVRKKVAIPWVSFGSDEASQAP